MLAAERCPLYDGVLPNRELFEAHRRKISLHSAKVVTDILKFDFPARSSSLTAVNTSIKWCMCPLRPQVVRAVQWILAGSEDEERMSGYNSFQMWVKRQRIPMSRFHGWLMLGDMRKWAEQQGHMIGWDPSNRAYVFTHGVSGADSSYYKHLLPDSVHDAHMKYWEDVRFEL